MVNDSTSILVKYRPPSFETFIGNPLSVKALAEAVRGPSRPHCYLFTGPSGVGKTTLARIVAKEVNAIPLEVDVAVHSSIEELRDLIEMAAYQPLSGENQCYILDEIHGASKKGLSALYKLQEDPPPWLYICMATTELGKLEDATKNRCYHTSLKPLKQKDVEDLITTVADLEEWKVADGVFQAMVQAAGGSARLALSILQAGHGAKDRNELSEIIAQVESEDNPAIKLIRHLMLGHKNWKGVSQLLAEIDGSEEDAINASSNWLAKEIVKSDEAQAQEYWRMLRAFTETNTWNKKIHYYCAIGKILWGQLPF